MSNWWTRHWLQDGIRTRTLFTGFWQAQRLLIQALWLVLVARILSVRELGEFMGLVGLAATLGGISGLGFGLVLFQDVVRERSVFGDRWRSTLATILLSGLVLGVVFIVAGPVITANAVPAIVLITFALSELIALPLTAASAFAFAAHERMGWSAALPAMLAAARLSASTLVWLWFDPTVLSIAIAHALASCTAAAVSIVAVTYILRPGPGCLRWRGRDFREGFGFCSVWAGTTALSSLDKVFALRWAGAEVAGHYSVAYRVSAIFAMPIEALTTSATPRLFKSTHAGDTEGRLTKRLFLAAAAYGVLAAAILWSLAPLVPLVFGVQYEEVGYAARVMALFVPLYGLRVLGGNILLSRGQAGLQSRFQILGIVTMIVLGAVLIPRLGLMGSILMTIASEALLCILIWMCVSKGTSPVAIE